MAYDGLVTGAVVRELQESIIQGKIEKIYQPQGDELVIHIHARRGNRRLYASVNPAQARLALITGTLENPPVPQAFCMLLRKHLQGGRIVRIEQHGAERIVEITVETQTELGFLASRKLIFEIMGKHSNIILTDLGDGRILDAIKHISFDTSRVRQVLPGLPYQYPPAQQKTPFSAISAQALGDLPSDGRAILAAVGGICPAFAEELAACDGPARWEVLQAARRAAAGAADLTQDADKVSAEGTDMLHASPAGADGVHAEMVGRGQPVGGTPAGDAAAGAHGVHPDMPCDGPVGDTARRTAHGDLTPDAGEPNTAGPAPRIYYDANHVPQEFYLVPLRAYEGACQVETFPTMSLCLESYFAQKSASNRGRQKAADLIRAVTAALDKLYLKKQRLSEDLLQAQNSENLRLYGELLTANLHLVKPGMRQIELISYYDGQPVTIPLDVRLSPAKNAQLYFKKYGKSKTAVREKQVQLAENDREIEYLRSVLAYLEETDSYAEAEALRAELVESGYLRPRKVPGGYREKKERPAPRRYTLPSGLEVLVGRNNRGNDYLTFKLAGSRDLWLHTKDIPGSHVILRSGGASVDEADILAAAAIAAYHSKGRDSENVPVDYVPVRYVKKPAGAKPGMVIFTNNRTVWVNPALPAPTGGR